MPMHAVIEPTGHITHAGPTLLKLCPGGRIIGCRLLEIFELVRPHGVSSMRGFRALAGRTLHFTLRQLPETRFTGIATVLRDTDRVLLNLSFGISVVEAVRGFDLTSADFAPTDLAVEMLYLVEAKSAAMDESRNLNTRLQGAKIAAEEQAFTDTLTGLKNRRAMDHILARMVASGGAFSLMHLDLDYFKAVNDSLGHAAGDHILQAAARIMVEASRSDDTVARVGGDEFVLILQGLTKPSRLLKISEDLIRRLEKPIPFNGETCCISGSIGITISTFYKRPNVEGMLQDADLALYASKDKGRGCATIHSPEAAAASEVGSAARSADAPPSAA